MSVLSGIGFGGDGASTPGYDVGHSVRFRSSVGGSLTRTTSAAGNTQTWTWNDSVKRGSLGSVQVLFEAYANSTSATRILFLADDTLRISHSVTSVDSILLKTVAVFRDPTAHYDITVTVDILNAAPTERVRLYVNGVRITEFSSPTYPSTSVTTYVNASGILHDIGGSASAFSQFFDGYRSNIRLIDGQALPPTAFGEFNANGVWVPKAYVGSYGTNGFYLPFNNATSLATLTADASGNNNNFTATNISLTAGPTYDWMEDTPTNNFAVLNPLETSAVTLSAANLNFSSTGLACYGSISVSSGKWYFEALFTSIGSAEVNIGLFSSSGVYIAYNSAGTKDIDTVRTAYGASYTTNVTIGVAVDLDANTVEFFRNNVSQGVISTYSFSGKLWKPFKTFRGTSGTDAGWFNFGQRPFLYTPPSGFSSICSNNTPAVAISNPKAHTAVYSYLGNGGGLQIGEIQRNLEPYAVSKSLRFRGGSTAAHLTRNPGTAGNRRKWTWSGWVRPSVTTGLQGLFLRYQDRGTNNFANYTGLFFDGGRIIFRHQVASAVVGAKAPLELINNPNLWYNIVAVFDSSNATAANRMRIWVNQVEPTNYNENVTLPLDTDGYINQATVTHDIGIFSGANVYALNGYLSQVHFIDGEALDPSFFGQTDGNGYWVPKQYTGAYGTNGFKLDFANTTSVSTLGSDVSGNGNNWSVSNVSLAADVTYDSMVDVPGNTYPTLDILRTDGGNANIFSNGMLSVAANGAATDSRVKVTRPLPSSGKFYMEWIPANFTTGDSLVGLKLTESSMVATAGGSVFYTQQSTNVAHGVYVYGTLAQAVTVSNNDVFGYAFDIDAGIVYIYKNNALVYTSPTLPLGDKYIGGFCSQTSILHFNFGQRPFTYTPPSGFLPLAENNIPVDPLNMEYPGLVWIKNRTAVQGHALFDSARGRRVYMSSNATAADTTDVNSLLQFNKEGFLIGSSAAVNTVNNNYIAWSWKLPQTGSSNTAGSITGTVFANAEAGVSAITYTGTGANATVGHGLSTAPKMVITKNRVLTDQPWLVWHTNLLGSEYLLLNTTNAKQSSASPWNNLTPTSSVINLGNSASSNSLNNAMVAYCFAEIDGFSRISSYVGNGNADGPFVYCGFRPSYLLIKAVSGTSAATQNWEIRDSLREVYNDANRTILRPNTTEAEITDAFPIDFVANGFKVRNNGTGSNESGTTYIFLAFAETPFKYARAR